MKKDLSGQFSAETLSIVGGHDPANAMNSIKNPIYQTSTFKFNTAEEGKAFFNTQKDGASLDERNNSLIYTRLNHPNLVAAEYRLAQLDGADDSAFFESGMAAISTADGPTTCSRSPANGSRRSRANRRSSPTPACRRPRSSRRSTRMAWRSPRPSRASPSSDRSSRCPCMLMSRSSPL